MVSHLIRFKSKFKTIINQFIGGNSHEISKIWKSTLSGKQKFSR